MSTTKTFCALCGVPFSAEDGMYISNTREGDLEWTTKFIALIKELEQRPESSMPKWYISGVGEACLKEGGIGCVPRQQKENDSDEVEKRVQFAAYTNRDGKHADSIAYPMHPICWRIFEQNYHTLATGTSPNLDNLASIFLAQPLETKRGIPLARGFRPNFSGDFDYGGAEDFWEEEEEGDSDFFDDSDSDEFEWMCRDPGHALGFETSVCWELPMIAMTKAAPPNLRSSSDTFSKLPLELLEMILSFLPTVSVRAIRMASRTFSSLVLTQAFGRSRFMFPHDLCHFSDFESSISLQDGAEIDWEDLCYMLWNTKSSNRGNMEWLENRRRISKITLPLAQILLEMDRESHEEEDHEEATAEKGT